MKYVCKICGFVYDDARQAVPFAQLPDTWRCPVCGAAKADFEPLAEKAAEPVRKAPAQRALPDDDMVKLSPAALSALCSNLARGCEKQYLPEEAALYAELAAYFRGITPDAQDADTEKLATDIEQDLFEGYPALRATGEEQSDRGALRVCTWGEKVTRMLSSLLQRWQREGAAFLEHTEVWVCTVCGFVYVGDTPPELCPVCKVPSWKFEQMERRSAS